MGSVASTGSMGSTASARLGTSITSTGVGTFRGWRLSAGTAPLAFADSAISGAARSAAAVFGVAAELGRVAGDFTRRRQRRDHGQIARQAVLVFDTRPLGVQIAEYRAGVLRRYRDFEFDDRLQQNGPSLQERRFERHPARRL